MTYKIKSLIYLSCFVFASVVYNITLKKNLKEISDKMELTETNTIADTNSDLLDDNPTE